VLIPIAALPELTAAEANATTGDVRDVVYAIVDKAYDQYVAYAALTNAPTKMVISRTASINSLTSTISYTYSFSFTVNLIPGEVVNE